MRMVMPPWCRSALVFDLKLHDRIDAFNRLAV